MNFKTAEAENFLLKSDTVVANLRYKSKQLQNLSDYSEIIESIEKMVSKAVNLNCEVQFFGSRVIGVASDESDLDIFVKINETSYAMWISGSGRTQHDDRFRKLTSKIRDSRDWHYKDTALYTSVPVIFTAYVPFKLNCDINILNGLGVENSKMIAHLFKIQPEAVSLYHFVRQWLKSQGFNYFKGYLITLLVIFFLQNRGFLPFGEDVMRGVHPKIIDECECQFDPHRSLDNYNCSEINDYKDHRRGFFEFYADFNMNKVMSCFSGKALDLNDHVSRFPRFLKKGIFISDLYSQRKNCGIVDFYVKPFFKKLCKASNEFMKAEGY